MRYLTWAVRLAIFLFLLAFAVKNTDPVMLRFYFELAWQAPLIVLLLAFFAAGAVFGLAAALATMLSQRRENIELRRVVRELEARAGDPPRPAAPPVVDA